MDQRQKGFLGYRQGWLSRGHAGGLGRIGTAATWAPREVHVDLSQELISGWTYQKFQAVGTWVFEKNGHFGRIDVALDVSERRDRCRSYLCGSESGQLC